MSDRPIQVGDLVCVVHYENCGHSPRDFLGMVGTVDLINNLGIKCVVCGLWWAERGSQSAHTTIPGTKDGHFPLAWLKRIPPLDELESEKNKEELTA